MPTLLHDWRQMPEGREKYQAYLCSREWGLLREQVRKRAGGICERCRTKEMDHVHHLTYERKYRERLEDLQALCKPCHDFTHGKSDADPARTRPVYVGGKRVRVFYLAGKITGTRWRNEIVEDWSHEQSKACYRAQNMESGGHEWRVVDCAAEAADGVFLDYAGPWWSSLNAGGHASSTDSVAPHAYGAEEHDNHGIALGYVSDEHMEWATGVVSELVEQAVKDADLIFAWIDSDDCLGTMFELGMARALGKAIVVASPCAFDWRETWLARQLCDYCIWANSAGEAWRFFWKSNVEVMPTQTAITSRRRK